MLALFREVRMINSPAETRALQWEAIRPQCFEELNLIQLKYKHVEPASMDESNQMRVTGCSAAEPKHYGILLLFSAITRAVKWPPTNALKSKHTHCVQESPTLSDSALLRMNTAFHKERLMDVRLFRGKRFSWISLVFYHNEQSVRELCHGMRDLGQIFIKIYFFSHWGSHE